MVITASAAEQKAGAPHWAFQPLKALAVPEGNAKEPVDRFVARELKKEGLHLSAEADRATLIRRVAFILTGLPPTVEEIEEFSSDSKRDGYERMVSRYLDSPRFGERWEKSGSMPRAMQIPMGILTATPIDRWHGVIGITWSGPSIATSRSINLCASKS